MYNYIRELHRLFDAEPGCTELRNQIISLQSELKKHLGDQDRKLLLRLTDAQMTLEYEHSLESFAAGFHTAHGILCELEARGSYSFKEEETKRICREPGREKEAFIHE